MYYVYILKDKNDKIYIGCTSDLRNRFREHLSGKVYSTRRMMDLQLFYYEAYNQQDIAFDREKKLKNFGSSYSGLLKRLKLK